ncbi:glycerate kinase [Lyngbya confervoides]|uniref:Glycerate kinase n=1 Tax=Lyngbya confervoides BDU141951 TaxID=1574623 RepID=A0ABD4T787_9CYAN|nr:glycerate kinase [Lyngbya confervoides]MCM1984594.1 glycerate kinase [Lyngbya confervoides BDU141951]
MPSPCPRSLLAPALACLCQGNTPSAAQIQMLDQGRWLCAGGRDRPLDLWRQMDQFQQIYPQVKDRCRQRHGLLEDPSYLLWTLWMPLAAAVAQRRRQRGRPIVQGLLGGQGTGKTTLCDMLSLILAQQGLRAASLSLDDLYQPYAVRQQLQRRDPRLRWRGPPGTHDLDLGLATLDQVRAGAGPLSLPRFDKSAHQGQGDRTASERVSGVDVLLFEGWFVGLRPLPDSAFDHPPPPIVTPAHRQFARDMNRALADYLPLWARLDGLWVLRPQDYRWSQQWRWEAEAKAMAANRPGMSQEEVAEFVDYFWRSLHPQLFLPALLRRASQAEGAMEEMIEGVIEIDRHHQPCGFYCPGAS